MKISSSFLSCKEVISGVLKLNETDTDYIHVDFIDGNFIKGKKIPFRTLKKISKLSSKRLDVHLMTNKLKKYIKKFSSLNTEYITFHVEVEDDLDKYIDLVHSYNIKCGIAINPLTSLEKLKPYLSKIDLVLVMSVTPGSGGQSFIPEVVDKVKELSSYLKEEHFDTKISIDGGINLETSNLVKPYIDILVVGSYITNSSNYQESISNLRI